MNPILQNKDRFLSRIITTLEQNLAVINDNDTNQPASSSVLFLIGEPRAVNGLSNTPCLILNKRSRKIRQPGDLCFPGGGPAPRIDAALAKLLLFPGLPLARWRSRTDYHQPENIRRLAQLLATSLRESFEEMRLIPLDVRFLGPLPPQRLIMFARTIYPMVGWVQHQKHFRLNGEVEKLVYISIQALLNQENYASFQLTYPSILPPGIDKTRREFPCFVHHQEGATEILWGATYRIVMTFLAQVFDFSPPETSDLPGIDNHLSPDYFNNSLNPPSKGDF